MVVLTDANEKLCLLFSDAAPPRSFVRDLLAHMSGSVLSRYHLANQEQVESQEPFRSLNLDSSSDGVLSAFELLFEMSSSLSEKYVDGVPSLLHLTFQATARTPRQQGDRFLLLERLFLDRFLHENLEELRRRREVRTLMGTQISLLTHELANLDSVKARLFRLFAVKTNPLIQMFSTTTWRSRICFVPR